MAAARQQDVGSEAGGRRVGGEPDDAAALATAVTALQDLDASALRRRWRTLVGGDPPRGLAHPLVLRMLAYKLQAERLGDLDKDSRRELEAVHGNSGRSLADSASTSDAVSTSCRTRIARPGTILMREHAGAAHRVTVLADGFSWSGRTFDSLSQVAFAITGTKWNGPRFFGLREKTDKGAVASGKVAKQTSRAAVAPSRGAAS